MNDAIFDILANVGYDGYRGSLQVDPIRHYDHPFIRALGERGFAIQTNYLHIPPSVGFFSPGPSRLQATESCFFVNVVILFLAIYPLLGILHVRRGPQAFVRRVALSPPAAFVVTWLLMCLTRCLAPNFWGA